MHYEKLLLLQVKQLATWQGYGSHSPVVIFTL